uniref:MBL fold metallo-hydrolase n=1 Tax=Cellvibrio fontiphilus TaxID=1815559 RepID=UPI002B4BC330|nr:MBL fold metallo-hydrolase [Cellvibrio fontiphilus]
MLQYQIIPVTHYQQNCTLLWCDETGDAALVDPGGDTARILAAVAATGVRLRKILLTHGHMDHIGGTAELVAQLQLPVIGPHLDDQFWIDLLPQQAQMMGFTPVAGFSPDQWLNHGDKVMLGKQELEVLHCPGHTPGHVIFYSRSAQLALVGDVLFKGSIGRTDFPRGNHAELINAIRTRVLPLGDEVRFIPGHGPMSTLGHERLTNPFVADKKYG